MKRILSCGVFFFCVLHLNAQSIDDSLYHPQQTIYHYSRGVIDSAANIRITNFIAPAVFITYGSIALGNNGLRTFDHTIQRDIKNAHPNFKTSIDDFLQYSPAAAVAVLQLAGVKGKNPPLREITTYATSMAIAGGLALPIKRWTHQLRPDSSDYQSFPSGHTTTAFASAEFLRIEYGQVSPWIAVGGYAAATATAVLRLYNNKHWFGNVIAGAGFGIISTDIGYLLNDKIFWRKKPDASLSIFPVYQNGSYGIGLVKIF